MDIKKYIGEASEYDKKQEVERRKVKSWLKSVSAFANQIIASRRYVREKMLVPAIEQGLVLMEHPDSPRHPKQRYYLSEKGLRLAEEKPLY